MRNPILEWFRGLQFYPVILIILFGVFVIVCRKDFARGFVRRRGKTGDGEFVDKSIPILFGVLFIAVGMLSLFGIVTFKGL